MTQLFVRSAVLALVLSLLATPCAHATEQGQILAPAAPSSPSTTAAPAPAQPISAQPGPLQDLLVRQAILVEAASGTILYTKDADARMPTSSMSKLLTMYLVFEAIKNGKLHMDDEVTVSETAWRQEGSRMFLNVGEKVKVGELVQGVIVQSGNDASVALAEAVGGSEGNFAGMMNAKAAELGMTNSHFMNATGLPDPLHYSTARDLALLALALIRDYPEHYHFYSQTEFTYNKIKQGNRNPLLYRGIGVDGFKTGHTEAAGFGLVASALRDGRRLVMVANGMNSMQARADESAKLLDWGYREYGLYPVAKKDEAFATARVSLGKAPSVSLVASQASFISLPRAARPGLKVQPLYNEPFTAPVIKGQILGKLVVTAPGMDSFEIPLAAADTVPELSFFPRMMAKIRALFGGKDR